jgi:hypothetical protein
MHSVSARTALALTLAAPLLAACYIVPLQPDGRPYPAAGTVMAPAPGVPAPQVLTARLYPANEIAARAGIIAGSVSSPQDGKGLFSIAYGGDTLAGEATRTSSGNVHGGIANASGARGTYVRCTYRMNGTAQGTGECLFSDGARFQLHVGG